MGRRPLGRTNMRHVQIVQTLRARAGEWCYVLESPSEQSARGFCRRVRTGELTAYRPVNCFETRIKQTREGPQVWIRYKTTSYPRRINSAGQTQSP